MCESGKGTGKTSVQKRDINLSRTMCGEQSEQNAKEEEATATAAQEANETQGNSRHTVPLHSPSSLQMFTAHH